jgi:hypothetical protein
MPHIPQEVSSFLFQCVVRRGKNLVTELSLKVGVTRVLIQGIELIELIVITRMFA